MAVWKREFLLVFSKEAPATKKVENLMEKELYTKIGELQV
jgi:hypothetical protein